MITDRSYQRAIRNSEFVLFKLANAREGDNIVVLSDSASYINAHMFCECAKMHSIHSCMIDVDVYGGDEGYVNLPIMEPVRQAILHSDITFLTTPQVATGFHMFLGSRSVADQTLTGVGQKFTFEIGGLDRWEINEEEVLMNYTRAKALHSWLKKADEVHVTTKKGTDLRVKVGTMPDGMYPVLGIIPFYSEVAVVPSFNSVNGVVIADGASEKAYDQHGFPIRPNVPGYNELYKEPLKMVFKDSYLTEYTGDPVQVNRLDKLMETVSPKPELCDELGIVTTTSVENRIYGWQVDHSHQNNCVHVAIGNNHERGKIIHSTEHIDFDVYDPTIEVDNMIIYADGKFNDELILSMQ